MANEKDPLMEMRMGLEPEIAALLEGKLRTRQVLCHSEPRHSQVSSVPGTGTAYLLFLLLFCTC